MPQRLDRSWTPSADLVARWFRNFALSAASFTIRVKHCRLSHPDCAGGWLWTPTTSAGLSFLSLSRRQPNHRTQGHDDNQSGSEHSLIVATGPAGDRAAAARRIRSVD